MLVLTRGKEQDVLIGDDIVVTVLEIRGDTVKLGIEAPKTTPVHRREVYERIQREQDQGTEAPVPGVSIPTPLAEAVVLATTRPGVLP